LWNLHRLFAQMKGRHGRFCEMAHLGRQGCALIEADNVERISADSGAP
jgi:hypothetical protein